MKKSEKMKKAQIQMRHAGRCTDIGIFNGESYKIPITFVWYFDEEEGDTWIATAVYPEFSRVGHKVQFVTQCSHPESVDQNYAYSMIWDWLNDHGIEGPVGK